jgi:hypothetical protein
MPSLTYNDYNTILEKVGLEKKDFNFFVETGTHTGHTVRNMIPHFDNIHTIELSEEYYQDNIPKFKDFNNVNLYLGDSSKVLDEIIDKFTNNTVFFLDGHWSGGDTAQGEKDCPLLEELNIITNKFNNKALIIIDDYRLFGTKGNEDWSDITLNNIKSIINSRLSTINGSKNPAVFNYNDRLIFCLNKN